jgi:curved DNA-binding protein CbpA
VSWLSHTGHVHCAQVPGARLPLLWWLLLLLLQEATAKFQALQRVYDVLSDPAK